MLHERASIKKLLLPINKEIKMKINNPVLQEQEQLNQKLATMLKSQDIKNLSITSYGNSIASGYSMLRTIKPLLLRNESIQQIMNSNGISLERHAFARAQNNDDEHLFDWLVSNVKESEINVMNRNDYGNGPTSMPVSFLDYQMIDYFYPLHMKENKGLQDILQNKDDALANIIVYNGCTGSFLDNITRDGKLPQKLTYGIKRDLTSLEAILKYIQSYNREFGTNIQLYICGAPNFLGINIVNIINNKLRRLAKKYANVSYVEPVKSKFFYKNIETGKMGADIHYDEGEYDRLNNHILSTIINNYQISQAMINTDRRFYRLSSKIEFSEERDSILPMIKSIMETEIESTMQKFISNEDKLQYGKRAVAYLKEREPYDFFYLGKKNIEKVINNNMQKINK